MMYKCVENSDGIILVIDGDAVMARYTVDRHWHEVNVSVNGDKIKVRLYNRLKGYLDESVKFGIESVQKIPAN